MKDLALVAVKFGFYAKGTTSHSKFRPGEQQENILIPVRSLKWQSRDKVKEGSIRGR